MSNNTEEYEELSESYIRLMQPVFPIIAYYLRMIRQQYDARAACLAMGIFILNQKLLERQQMPVRESYVPYLQDYPEVRPLVEEMLVSFVFGSAASGS